MNILERDIENALFTNPELLPAAYITGMGAYTFMGWLARQYSVPSGRIDLLGLLRYDTSGFDFLPPHLKNIDGPTYHPLIVELKRGKIDAAAVAQVGRYLCDIRDILDEVEWAYGVAPTGRAMFPVIIGESVDYSTLRSAAGLGVKLLGYSLEPFSITPPFSLSQTQLDRETAIIGRLIDDRPFLPWRHLAIKDRLAMGWPEEAAQ